MKIFTKRTVTTLIAIGVLFQTHAKETYTVTDKNADKTIHIKFKDYDTIRVELPRALVSMGNITAWQFKKASGPVTSPTKNVTPNDRLDGSAGKDVFIFYITKTGFANLDFEHVLITPQEQVINEVLIPSSTSFNIQIT